MLKPDMDSAAAISTAETAPSVSPTKKPARGKRARLSDHATKPSAWDSASPASPATAEGLPEAQERPISEPTLPNLDGMRVNITYTEGAEIFSSASSGHRTVRFR